jgi:hypothetical protein
MVPKGVQQVVDEGRLLNFWIFFALWGWLLLVITFWRTFRLWDLVLDWVKGHWSIVYHVQISFL